MLVGVLHERDLAGDAWKGRKVLRMRWGAAAGASAAAAASGATAPGWPAACPARAAPPLVAPGFEPVQDFLRVSAAWGIMQKLR
jgi:hypothetical protein